MNITKTTLALGLASGLFAQTLSASGTELTIPPSSEFVDAESSVNVPLPTDEGRRIRLTLAFASTPSNAVQVAFGNDLNGSENLEPEETELVLGVDCGEPYMVGADVLVRPQSSNNEIAFETDCISTGEAAAERSLESCVPGGHALPTNAVVHVFQLKQPRERWSLAKVTTHNLADTNLIVTAEFYNRGQVLFLR